MGQTRFPRALGVLRGGVAGGRVWKGQAQQHAVLSASFFGVSPGISFEEKAARLKRKFEIPFTSQMSRRRPRVIRSHSAT